MQILVPLVMTVGIFGSEAMTRVNSSGWSFGSSGVWRFYYPQGDRSEQIKLTTPEVAL